jgi:hypothetical protein
MYNSQDIGNNGEDEAEEKEEMNDGTASWTAYKSG